MEIAIIRCIQSFATPFLDVFFQFVTFLGEEAFIFAVLTFVYWNVNKQMGRNVAFTLFLSFTVNGMVKDFFKWSRPIGVEGVRSLRIQTATGYSFPSGHSQGAATFFGSFAFHARNRWIAIGSITIVLLVGISRLYLGVHYPKDVVVGWILGLVIAAVLAKYPIERWNVYLLGILVVIIGVGVALVGPSSDSIRAYGLLIGYLLGIYFEKKYVNFQVSSTGLQKIVRWIFGFMLLVILKEGMGAFLPTGQLSYGITYGVLAFIGIAGYPFLCSRMELLGWK